MEVAFVVAGLGLVPVLRWCRCSGSKLVCAVPGEAAKKTKRRSYIGVRATRSQGLKSERIIQWVMNDSRRCRVRKSLKINVLVIPTAGLPCRCATTAAAP